MILQNKYVVVYSSLHTCSLHSYCKDTPQVLEWNGCLHREHKQAQFECICAYCIVRTCWYLQYSHLLKFWCPFETYTALPTHQIIYSLSIHTSHLPWKWYCPHSQSGNVCGDEQSSVSLLVLKPLGTDSSHPAILNWLCHFLPVCLPSLFSLKWYEFCWWYITRGLILETLYPQALPQG